MAESSGRERDLVLAPNQFAFIQDETKGHVVVYVGPHKTSLANTDRPVIFSSATRKYERTQLEGAIQEFLFAPEGWYIVLENPSSEKSEEHPRAGSSNTPRLEIGRKINTPGPASFPLWPTQIGTVVQGHHLRSNQYLVVRVYNEDEATRNWKKAIIKPQRGAPTPPPAAPAGAVPQGRDDPAPVPAVASEVPPVTGDEAPELTMGKLLVIMGTDVSFYIPPTGIEVVPDSAGNYVREAVTLERLEYCILLDEDGEKRYVRGPAVVFPRPTESFIESKIASRKFRAIELNEISGIYVKVIAPYEEGDVRHEVGEELFITGKEQMIYFPRPEHAIIRYGDDEKHFAVAIPAGEGRYVLDRLTGAITTEVGPRMLLPDPRRQVIVRRLLSERVVGLLYPGNAAALAHNAELARLAHERNAQSATLRGAARGAAAPLRLADVEEATEALLPDDFVRRQGFTQPRTVTLDTKFEGAVSVNVWTGYAVLVVSKTGQRRVVIGPQTVLLGYDENLEAMSLSTGTPKADASLLDTVFLRVLNNKVSDVVVAETSDLCQVSVRLSYRVNFEGEPEHWFNVENYVRFLTDHLRSVIRNTVKQTKVETFYSNAIGIIRDSILGPAVEGGKRRGRTFVENGMRVYDVEVLDVKIGDAEITKLLTSAQHVAVRQTIELAQEQRRLEVTRATEEIKRTTATVQSETAINELKLLLERTAKGLELDLAKTGAEIRLREERAAADLRSQETQNHIHVAELKRSETEQMLELTLEKERLEHDLRRLKAEVDGVVEKAKAITPQLISALQTFGDRRLAGQVAESMAPMALLGGDSVADVFGRILKGTVFEKLLVGVPANGNGAEEALAQR